MKTSFKKEFNNFEEDFNIEETTINENLGIDPHKIKINVLAQISSLNKKKSRKGFTIFLIAAAVSATVLGTTAIAATINKNHTADFTDIFDGDVSFLDVKEARDFRFEPADPNLQAEFLGVVSDGETAIASVILTKKDGSAFADKETDILNPEGILLTDLNKYDLESSDYLSAIRNMEDKPDYQYVFYTLNDRNNINEQSAQAVNYIFNKDRTEIKMYIEMSAEYGTISGGRGEISSEYVNLFKYSNKIAEYNQMNDENYSNAKELCNKKSIDYDNECKWLVENGKYILYQIETEKYDLVYDMSFKMDFETNRKIQTVFTDRQAPHFLTKDSDMTMTMTPLSLSLKSLKMYTEEEVKSKLEQYSKENNYTKEQLENVAIDFYNSNIDYNNSKIIMKDGTEYYFINIESGIASYKDEYEPDKLDVADDIQMAFSAAPYNNNFGYGIIKGDVKKAVVDPEKVSSIIINGDTIYQAPDERSASSKDTDLDKPYTSTDIKNRKFPVSSAKEYKEFILSEKAGLVENELLKSYDIYDVYDFEDESGFTGFINAKLTLNGTKNQILNIINNLIKDEENGLMIGCVEISDKPDVFGLYTMNLYLESYFMKDGSTPSDYSIEYYECRWNGSDLYTAAIDHFNGKTSEMISVINTEPDFRNLTNNLNSYERNKSISKELNHENAPKTVKEGHNVTMTVTPSKILISSVEENCETYDKESNNYNYSSMYDPEYYEYTKSKVIMKDGTEYFIYYVKEYESANYGFGLEGEVSDVEYPTVKHDIILSYSTEYIPCYKFVSVDEDEINSKAVQINTSDIASIILNGSNIYTSED